MSRSESGADVPSIGTPPRARGNDASLSWACAASLGLQEYHRLMFVYHNLPWVPFSGVNDGRAGSRWLKYDAPPGTWIRDRHDRGGMMMRQMRGLAMFAVVAALMAYGLDGGVFAQDATPVTTSEGGHDALVVIDHATTETVIDLSEVGDSIGDLLAFGNTVYDAGNDTEVGTNQGSCVRTVPGKAWECMFTIILDEGQLTVAGPLYDAGPSELAITGGTGAYATARGQMRLEATSETESRFTFEIA